MAQVSCNRVRIKTGSLDAVHAWARTINTRRVEALATLHDERVQLESVFLEHAADGDFSSTTCAAKTLAKARELAKSSRHLIDEYHQRFMREHTDTGPGSNY
jgi:hypothetical protein